MAVGSTEGLVQCICLQIISVIEEKKRRERRFGTGEPPQTHVTELYVLCYFCNAVVRGGSRRFDALELPRIRVLWVRGGSTVPNLLYLHI